MTKMEIPELGKIPARLPRENDWTPEDIDPEIGPYTTLSELRGQCPMAWTNDGSGYWTVTRYEDVTGIARDTARFSNVPRHPRIGTVYTPPLEADRPDHTPFRRALNPFFTKEYLAAKEPAIRELAAEMLIPLIDAASADISEKLCQQLPAIVLCRLIGMPDSDWTILRSWTEESFLAHRDRNNEPEIFSAANQRINEYGQALIDRTRTETGRDDIITALLESTHAQENFSDEDVFGLVRLLLQAGHSTTAMAMANVLYHIGTDQELQKSLRKDKEMIPAAIMEILRLDTPVMANIRRVKEDTKYLGRELKKDEHVMLAWSGGNRDSSKFGNPDEIDLLRDPRLSLTFGHGVHKCPGMPLAVLEIRMVVEELLARTSLISVDGPIERKGWEANGVKKLPMSFHP